METLGSIGKVPFVAGIDEERDPFTWFRFSFRSEIIQETCNFMAPVLSFAQTVPNINFFACVF
jgi:hypothetical protein